MYFIAIDGGGTKTDIVLFDETGKVVRRYFTVASCPTSIGLSASFENVSYAIQNILLDTEIPKEKIVSVYAGIAGCGVHSIGYQYTSKMKSIFSPSTIVDVSSDIINVLNCGLSTDDGMALICGTGSSLLVRSGSEYHQVGGWGYLLGDEGSGYDIGRMGLTAALKAYDGRDSKTLLSTFIENKLGEPVQNCIAKLYEGGKSFIASFAPEVFEAALLNDKTAVQIINHAADSLRDLMIAGSQYLDGEEYNTVLAGGIWKAGNGILKKILNDILPDNFNIICPEIPPVFGAAVQAMNNANIRIENDFKHNFQKMLNTAGRN